MEKVVVTGSAGFIGSHLVKELKEKGYGVKGFDILDGQDITDSRVVDQELEGADFCIHLAGMLGTHELVDNTRNAAIVNIIGTINVLDACKKHKVKLIEISKPNVWLNTYSITKEAAESFTQMYRTEHGVKAAVLKWFNVYGTGQGLFEEVGYRKAIPTWIVNGLKGKTIEIYGNGEQTMDLVHTDDTVDSVIAVLKNFDKCEGKTFEVGRDEITANEVAQMIKDMTGDKSEIVHIDMRPGEVMNTKLKADTLMLSEIGWQAKVSLVDGLKDTIEYYKDNYLAK